MLAAAVVAYVYTGSQPTTYQTSARMMAVAQPPDYWLDLYAKNRLASYKDLINNWEFVTEALKAANLTVDPAQAIGSLTTGHNPDSNTVQIVVTDTDPVRAASVANALADAFVARSNADNDRIANTYRTTDNQPHGVVEMLKLDTPSPPTTPIGPRVKLNTAAAAILGLVFGTLLTFAVEYLDDTLRTDADVDRYLELPTIVAIPRG
jgi:capsular polysaccharide biosynthesis protein